MKLERGSHSSTMGNGDDKTFGIATSENTQQEEEILGAIVARD